MNGFEDVAAASVERVNTPRSGRRRGLLPAGVAYETGALFARVARGCACLAALSLLVFGAGLDTKALLTGIFVGVVVAACVRIGDLQ